MKAKVLILDFPKKYVPQLITKVRQHDDGREVTSALHLLSSCKSKGQPLSLDTTIDSTNPLLGTVRNHLRTNPPGPITPEANLLDETSPPDHDRYFVIFDNLNATLITQTALKTTGAAGPSGIDAVGWRRLCSLYKGSPFSVR